jgi:methylated-DNA-[protein]-cysteine S-methyltransferase
MEMTEGSCPLGLWHVHVTWDNTIVHRVRFHKTALPGPVPIPVTRYLAGKSSDLEPLESPLLHLGGTYGRIYQVVSGIPYGSVQTYGTVAKLAGTHARVVGLAMMRNTTPLIVPCHRVVAAGGIGGFTPDIWIKEELLRIERNGTKKSGRKGISRDPSDTLEII